MLVMSSSVGKGYVLAAAEMASGGMVTFTPLMSWVLTLRRVLGGKNRSLEAGCLAGAAQRRWHLWPRVPAGTALARHATHTELDIHQMQYVLEGLPLVYIGSVVE